MPLALRFLGHRCSEGSAIKPWYYVGHLDLEPGAEFPVPQGGVILGRGRDAGVRVASNGVARQHVRVTPLDDGRALRAEDLQSTNGTQKNGVRGEVHELAPGDVLTLAGVFDFEVVALPPA
jgi:hypothetical protein